MKRYARFAACSAAIMAVVVASSGCLFNARSISESSEDWCSASDLRPGDLLFQDLDCGPLCDAIEAVTDGVDGADFSHVGIVSRVDGGGVTVIEAVSAGVVETPLTDFLARSADAHGRPKVLVGRVSVETHEAILGALRTARRHLGKPYDHYFEMGNDAFYCSELVYEAFRKADASPLFQLQPMTFNDPGTGTPFPAWVEYYKELGEPIPEGWPGLNPGGISRAPVVKIIGAFGVPDGWTGQVSRRSYRERSAEMRIGVGGGNRLDVEEANYGS